MARKSEPPVQDAANESTRGFKREKPDTGTGKYAVTAPDSRKDAPKAAPRAKAER